MAVISQCPKCRQPVTIPDGIGCDIEVRCPLCADVYPLGEAMAGVPPALIPVKTEGTTGQPGGSDATSGSGLVCEPFHVDRSPKAATESVVGKGPSTEEEGPRFGSAEKVDAAPQINTTGAGEGSPAIDTGQIPVDSEALAGLRIEGDEPPDQPAGETPARHRRPTQRKQKSVAKELLGAVFGGLLGLAIGYYLLNWFGGQRFDFLNVYLPGVPHTYQYWPAAKDADVQPLDDATKRPRTGDSAEPGPTTRRPASPRPLTGEGRPAQPETPPVDPTGRTPKGRPASGPESQPAPETAPEPGNETGPPIEPIPDSTPPPDDAVSPVDPPS
ncbi:MAG: hypothetical protein JXB62_12070 [Pirellulales bacterium]|nr:hypothetical protein [Pirellulales bacterium]